jgi:glycosyltransferase involved in cell wall biosynthesis
MKPRVSAVIPTFNRPDMVCRAVRSVLSQTVQELECIVIIDGPDAATSEALAAICDTRLKIVALRDNVGGCEARNIGARNAEGDWVALLDDDDEWLPQRLEKQLATTASLNLPVTMVASRFLDRGTGNELVRPHRFPKVGQHISEFLWCEVSLLGGIIGFPQTSTWLIRREFFLEVPFTRGLKCLQDLDWLLHAFANSRMCARFVEEPLTVFHNDHTHERLGIDWRSSHRWAMQNREFFTRKAFGFFIVIYCVNPAAAQGASWNELYSLFSDIRRAGQVTPKLLWLYLLYTLLYPTLRRVLPVGRRKVWIYKLLNLAPTMTAERSS